jgi:cytochrome c5
MPKFSKILCPIFSVCGFALISTVTAEARDPEKIFNDFCFSCHGTGWEDAPVIGDNFAWEDRKSKGIEVLLQNTLRGVNAMPTKGSCTDCTDKELQAVIEYLIAD